MRKKQDNTITLQSFSDKARGDLYVGEAKRNIPFQVKRFYVITHIPDSKVIRGAHAHRKIEQVMFCVRGSCLVRMDDGKKKWEVRLTRPEEGLYIGSGIWHDFTGCSPDTVILMVASGYYSETDYIRDYPAFLKFIQAKR